MNGLPHVLASSSNCCGAFSGSRTLCLPRRWRRTSPRAVDPDGGTLHVFFMHRFWWIPALASLAGTSTALAQPGDGSPEPAALDLDADAAPPSKLRLRADAELGFLAPVRHTVQFSEYGTRIDYRRDGAQDVLFPFARLSTTLRIRERHAVTLLYQPLELNTEAVARRDLVVDDETFIAGTPMRFTYGFPFWRAGWGYDMLRDPQREFRLGAALQIRNATIEFASLDGEQLVSNRDVGPVPLLHAMGRTVFRSGTFVEGEFDGFYAPIKYINGGSSDVVGAIVDLSLRGGIVLRDEAEGFINLRYLGGGAEGTSDDRGPGDGFTRNWLHFVTLSLGARLHLS